MSNIKFTANDAQKKKLEMLDNNHVIIKINTGTSGWDITISPTGGAQKEFLSFLRQLKSEGIYNG
jgi:hypothetical protein